MENRGTQHRYVLMARERNEAEFMEGTLKSVVAQTVSDVDEVTLPFEAEYAHHAYHVLATRRKNRDDLIAAPKEKEIHCGFQYPRPMHLQGACHDLGYGPGSFPVAESCVQELVS